MKALKFSIVGLTIVNIVSMTMFCRKVKSKIVLLVSSLCRVSLLRASSYGRSLNSWSPFTKRELLQSDILKDKIIELFRIKYQGQWKVNLIVWFVQSDPHSSVATLTEIWYYPINLIILKQHKKYFSNLFFHVRIVARVQGSKKVFNLMSLVLKFFFTWLYIWPSIHWFFVFLCIEISFIYGVIYARFKFQCRSWLAVKKILFFSLISERFWINACFNFGSPRMNS